MDVMNFRIMWIKHTVLVGYCNIAENTEKQETWCWKSHVLVRHLKELTLLFSREVEKYLDYCTEDEKYF